MTERVKERIMLSGDIDFSGYPYGGILSLLKDYLKFFSPGFAGKITLLGITTNKDQVGRSAIKHFGANSYKYWAAAHTPPSSTRSIRLAYNLGVVSHYALIRKLRCDVIYAHTNENGLLMKMLFPTKRVVVHFHGIENPVASCRYPVLRQPSLAKLYDLLCLRFLACVADGIIVNIDSERFENFMGRFPNHRSKFVRIPPLIDSDIFRPSEKEIVRQQLGFNQTDNILVFHGRLEYAKGVDLVISALNLVAGKVPNTRLIIIGDGSQENALQEQVRRSRLTDHVLFTGNKSRTEIGHYLAASDVFVTGTHFEAISVALLEAIGCGLPVVTTPVGGVRDIVRNGFNGYCLNAWSAEEMADKIMGCLKADRRRLKENVLETAKLFSPDCVVPLVQKAILGFN